MSIIREDCDGRQTRVEMIAEFRHAQSRRLARSTTVSSDDQAVDSRRDADVLLPIASTTAAPPAPARE